jgi:hypothetical protein
MKFPYLKNWDNNPFYVEITDGIDDNGAPKVVTTYTGLCNFSEKSKTIRDKDGQWVQLNASLMIGKDIAPEVPVLVGHVYLPDSNGRQWKIWKGSRVRNPDGTVNHTVLELM